MRPAKLRILLCVLFLVIVSLVSLAVSYRTTPVLPSIDIPPDSQEAVAVGTPLAAPTATPVEDTGDSAPPATANFVGKVSLIIPVAGVRAEQLIDTFTDARSEGRSHDAIDIPAAFETPVLAASDGKILKLFHSEKGGTTIYQLGLNQDLVFYYAHLSRYADGLAEGDLVKQGQVIAYVGDTGNAGPGNYHLHFSIALAADPKRYWEGVNINPYPLLQNRAQ
jgi:peptidoglycan LD-endopeptidase LytH